MTTSSQFLKGIWKPIAIGSSTGLLFGWLHSHLPQPYSSMSYFCYAFALIGCLVYIAIRQIMLDKMIRRTLYALARLKADIEKEDGLRVAVKVINSETPSSPHGPN